MSHATQNPLSYAVWAKIDEQSELLCGIIAKLPAGKLDWAPPMPLTQAPPPKRVAEVLGHLLQCFAGVLAVLHAAHPDRLQHFMELKNRRVNHYCTEAEALERVAEYRRYIREGFESLSDEDLAVSRPTVFVPAGESVLTLLLGNLEHILNHKHELFVYAKGLGASLVSRDLYRFRTELASRSGPESSGGPNGVSSAGAIARGISAVDEES